MKRLALIAALLASAAPAIAQQADPLVEGFERPPADARPLAYWQWINGNVSEEGIRQDFAWMKRIGLGGVFVFDVGFNSPPIPQYVDKRVGFGSPEWKSAVHVAAVEAKRLDLSFGAQSSGGWSVSGDPSVTPQEAMKKLVWSETIVGPGKGAVTLAPPPSGNGPYQDTPTSERNREPRLSGEVAVLAYRLSDAEAGAAPSFTVTGTDAPALLGDGKFDAATKLVPDAAGNITLAFRFAQPVAPGAVTVSTDGDIPGGVVLDGSGATRATLGAPAQHGARVRTILLGGAPSRDWTIRFTGLDRPLSVREARFAMAPRINRIEDKAGYGTLFDYESIRTPGGIAGTPAGSVIDISDRMRADGMLDWRPKAGRWAVLRFGWSLTGSRSTPASRESVGLEVDKLDADVVRAYANRFYDRYKDAVGSDGRMNIAISDSWEAGQQSWSPKLLADFKRLRGYDPLPWLPVLTGRIVDDSERSERFLADWRRTIGDLIAANHYGVFAEVLRARGLTYYAEAPGTDLPTVADGIQTKSLVDVPMGEYWYWPAGGAPKPEHIADMREAASAAHLTGKTMVAAEALTTMGDEPWATGPREWRRPVDRFFAEGVNKIVMHTFAHQPFTDGRKPGMTLRQYGQHFTRNEAWAELADGWTNYLARSSFLLQQGQPVADIAVFHGEDGASAAPHHFERLWGFDYDFIDRTTLLQLTPDNGGFVTPAGMRYRLLMLAPGVRHLSLPVLRQLKRLADANVTITGDQPKGPIGLGTDATEFAALADAIWDKPTPDAAIPPDVWTYDGRLDWKHRIVPDGDIYFLSNPEGQPFEGTVTFRGDGLNSPPASREGLGEGLSPSRAAASDTPSPDPSRKREGSRTAELWNAEDGLRTAVPLTSSPTGHTVRVSLPAYSSRFILLRRAAASAPTAAPRTKTKAVALDGPWSLSFLDGMGAPPTATFDSLHSLTESEDPAIRYYSGRVSYRQTFRVRAMPRIHAWLDLGAVGDMARVIVNGQDLGVTWTQPARVDIAGALKRGENSIEIITANYFQNRLIGDRQPGAKPQTFAPITVYAAGDKLRPSGLIGPVMVSVGR
ncbi:glycosyl hydrolase [Sphingomonas sanxanigenens]|uniref:Glycosyl hydrolases family 2 sugar binding domain-containing protein n=1 Tax=Sphingomonas sanxanigenens DSM 19645 = NX02 TaxID=1123269 RepID=W0AJ71_9SPHN|nr:glycosyl hydrolase [Sphingomonas sanxanigenens]AHE55710.1 hypothetical protein NX02_20265 [Sphingomonas sanxanigenens DSM 19645 = NX02]